MSLSYGLVSYRDDIRCQLLFQIRCDHAPMEPPILDENLTGTNPCDNHAREINARNAAFQGLRIHNWLLVIVASQAASHATNKFEVGMVSGECKNPIVGQSYFTFAAC